MNIIEKVTTKVSETKDGLLDQIGRMTDLSDAVRERSAEYLNQIVDSAPALADAGFIMGQISVCLSLPPSATIKFAPTGEVSEERFESAIQQSADRPLVQAILRTLRGAEKFRSSIKVGKFHMDGIEVSLGLSPAVTLHLVPKGNC